MLQHLIESINLLRTNHQLWKNLRWVPQGSGKDYFDINSINRTRAAIALQFDYQESDEALLKFIFSEEIKNRHAHPFQGIGETLNRCAYLLAKLKKVENVWLFLQAKTANFDTHCGFDYEHIVSAGIEKTFHYVENTSYESQDQFFDYFPSREECVLTEEEITDWFKTKEEWFPREKELSDLEFWIRIAREAKEKEETKKLIGEYERSYPMNNYNLFFIKEVKMSIGDLHGAIEAAEKCLLLQPAENRFYDHQDLIQLYLFNKQPEKAWMNIKKVQAEYTIDEYQKGLLGEMAVDIVLAARNSEKEYEIQAYNFAIAAPFRFLSLNLLEKLVKAAELMGDQTNLPNFKELYNEEKRRIDQLFDQ